MDDDTIEPFGFPAIGRKKLTAAFDGGRLTSDGGVMLLAAAERHLGICDRLAALISDPRDPSRVVHPLADILRARILAIACGYEDADDLDHLRRDPGPDLVCQSLDPRLDLLLLGEILRVGGLAAGRFPRPVRTHGPVVLPPRDGMEMRPGLPEVLGQEGQWPLPEILARMDAQTLHLPRRRGADPVEPGHLQPFGEGGAHLRRDDELPVGLAVVR